MKKAKCKVKGERLESYDAAEMNLKGPQNIFFMAIIVKQIFRQQKITASNW
jgi:hypothetical protein